MSKIQAVLRENGLDKTVKDLNLIFQQKDSLVLLKYKQHCADWRNEALHNCRGIILDSNQNWKIVAYPYDKFFNLGEGYAARIDWTSAKVYKKYDGSLINLYHYNEQWNVQTTGMIDASGYTSGTISFCELFWKTVGIMYKQTKEEFCAQLDVNKNYFFELCTPDNIVIVPTQKYNIYLHGVRNMITLKEESIESVNLISTEMFNLTNVKEVDKEIQNMPWTEEGYVVVDENFQRVKIKNPKYVAVHMTKFKQGRHMLINVIKLGDQDEHLVYFPDDRKELDDLTQKWNLTQKMIQTLYDTYCKLAEGSTSKFANKVKMCTENSKTKACLFMLWNKKAKTVFDAMCTLDDKFLYTEFLKL